MVGRDVYRTGEIVRYRARKVAVSNIWVFADTPRAEPVNLLSAHADGRISTSGGTNPNVRHAKHRERYEKGKRAEKERETERGRERERQKERERERERKGEGVEEKKRYTISSLAA